MTRQTHIYSILQFNKKWLILFLGLFFFLGLTNTSFAQKNETQANKKIEKPKKLTPTGNTSIREEIQRYLGYEELPARYLSLPYDASMNTNVRGPFVDISCLYLIFIPVFFLLGYWKRPIAGSLFIVFSLLVLTISVANSIMISPQTASILNTKDGIANYLQQHSFSEVPIDYIVAQIHYMFRVIYEPLDHLFKSISGDFDYITYPLLFILFIGGFFVVNDRIKKHDLPYRALVVFTYLFGFLWLLLTAGIIWYGYLMIALGMLYVIYPFSKKLEEEALVLQKFIRGFAVVFLIIGVYLMFNIRTMNYQRATNDEIAKQMLFDPALISYQFGKYTKREALDAFFSDINTVLDKINREDKSRVYRVGTIFPFFIRKNDRRILVDNQLGIFNSLKNKYPNNNVLTEVLIANDFKYVLVDLNTSQIDETPEKSLTKKFNMLMNFIINNPKFKLLLTDRGIVIPGETQMVRKVLPDTQNGERVGIPGSYAIYEIL